MFSGDIRIDYFIQKVNEQFNQFGNRTKTIADTESTTDFKALSHSLRIMMEVNELLETSFIKFPLTYSNIIKDVKSGNCNVYEIINTIEESLSMTDTLLENSDLPSEPNNELIKKLLLSFYI